MKERKRRSDCVHYAKCGLMPLWMCRQNKAKLKECVGCKLVVRLNDRWKMIDRKPHRKCRKCGEFLPLDKFYPKCYRMPDGTKYHSTESICKMCRSKQYYEKKGVVENDSV